MSEVIGSAATADITNTPTSKHTLLLVDDEEGILDALKRVFRKENYRIIATTQPQEGLAVLKREPITLVISDHRMPDMEGIHFLSQVREMRPDTMRILLTGYADLDAVVKAINTCEVFRYIAKPWNDDDLRLTVREALRQSDLVNQNRRLTAELRSKNQELADMNRGLEQKVRDRTEELEKKNRDLSILYQRLESNFLESVQALTSVLELKSSLLTGRGRRVGELASAMASHLGLPVERQTYCSLGGLLMDIGTVGYPDSLLKKREDELDNLGRTLWQKHPLLGEAILGEIEKLKPVSAIVRGHHERYDGKGFPDGLRGEDIPLEARILTTADVFDQLVSPVDPKVRPPMPKAEALSRLDREKGMQLDPRIFHALVDVVQRQQASDETNEVEVSVEDLVEGMTLARDLKTRGGILLAPLGTRLLGSHLERIRKFHRIDTIVDRVYVFRKSD